MPDNAPALLDRFVPQFDVRGRHEIIIHAPASLVMDVARNFEIESLWIVRTLFRLRARLLGASEAAAPRSGLVNSGLVGQMLSIGWQSLADEPGRYFIAGAACQPWQPDPAFSPIVSGDFASFSAPDRVKIAWTLEAAEIGPALTRFSTETRAVATDEPARAKFHRYWRKFGAGIILIRLVLLPAVRRRAERRWRAQQ
jgi:hypothetical protein